MRFCELAKLWLVVTLIHLSESNPVNQGKSTTNELNSGESCNCNVETTETTNEGLVCQKETGQCGCIGGFYGKNCNEICQCNIENTKQGTVCKKENGQCECKAGFFGRTCDERFNCDENGTCNRETGQCICKAGFHGDTCMESCNCDETGSSGKECDATGQCKCKAGFTGKKCNSCDTDDVYGTFPNCTACACDSKGSSGTTCDALGQCLCKEGYTGKHCNSLGKVNKFLVDAKISMRYAVTETVTEIMNTAATRQKVIFEFFIPRSAFVSHFSMKIKDELYTAKVETKERARDIFNETLGTAGTVTKLGQYVSFAALLDPNEAGNFTLVYEQLLTRDISDGLYHYELDIKPKTDINAKFSADILLDENYPIENLTTSGYSTDFVDKVFDPKRPNEAFIQIRPESNENWNFVLKYDIKRWKKDPNVVEVSGGKFIHSFAPDLQWGQPKHITFVIDVSGSMCGQKNQQTIDAMTTILDIMKERKRDFINIILFESDVKPTWPTDSTTVSYSVKDRGVKSAIDYAFEMPCSGTTNIDQAFKDALRVAKSVKENEELPDDMEQAILFLTDGLQNVGETKNEKIISNVKAANSENVSIYTLAFGEEPDLDLLRTISKQNNGFTKQISITPDTSIYEEVEKFYSRMTGGKDIRAEYNFTYIVNGIVIEPEQYLLPSVFQDGFGLFEYVGGGQTKDGSDIQNISIKIRNKDGHELKGYNMSVCSNDKMGEINLRRGRCFQNKHDSQEAWLRYLDNNRTMEKLWANRKIGYLLDKDSSNCRAAMIDRQSSKTCEQEATEIALRHHFVTDVTSLVVEETDEYKTPISINFTEPTAGDILGSNSHIDPVRGSVEDRPGCKITLYGRTHGRHARSFLYSSDGEVEDLSDPLHDFSDEVASIRVEERCCLTLFNEPNFRGDNMTFGQGSYDTPFDLKKVFKEASSAKIWESDSC